MPENLWNRNVVMGLIGCVILGYSLYGFIGLYTTYLREGLLFSQRSMRPLALGAMYNWSTSLQSQSIVCIWIGCASGIFLTSWFGLGSRLSGLPLLGGAFA